MRIEGMVRDQSNTDLRGDILITNGKIVDGCGNPWYYGDIGVKDGYIVNIGDLRAAEYDLIIDASGKIVSPGFIDMHSGISSADPLSESKIRQGVTTVVGGAGEPDVSPVGRSFTNYLETGNSLNYGRYCSPPLGRIIGKAKRRPTPAELDQVSEAIRKAMEDGALGITFGLRYFPQSLLTTEDVIAITRVVKDAGGYYNTHMRSESDNLLESVEEVIEINKAAGIPTHIGHLKAIGPYNWGKSYRTVQMIEDARASGLQITADMYPYEWSGTGLDVIIPHWAKEGDDTLLGKWQQPELKARIAEDIVELVGRRGGADAIVISSFSAEPELQGKTLQQAAELKGFSVAEQVMYMVQNGRAVCHYHVMSPLDVEHIMSSPWVAIGSDAGAVPPGIGSIKHPRSYGTFPRILDYYVKETQLLSLEDAVRKMTSLPAQILGIRNRGRILEGHKADLVVLDLSQLRDNSTFEHPDRSPDGIEWVVVNGVVVLDHEKHTGEKPGELICGAGRK